MSDISRAALFGKLNPLAYRAIEGATTFCKLRGNPYVELAHWLHQILQTPGSDLHEIIKHFELDPGRISSDLVAALDQLPRGASTISDLSEHIEDAVERGWVYGTLMFNQAQVRTGFLVIGILKTRTLMNVLFAISPEFRKIQIDSLTDQFAKIVARSPEENLPSKDGKSVGGGAVPGEASGAMSPAQLGKQEALAQFTVDLTERASQGKIDPIVGRDDEIRQVIDILMRRRQNNPILTGEAGVGKTAVVEGFAHRIHSGDVPPPLQDVRLLMLDVGLLQAGASMKGEFENRLRQVIEEVQASEKPIILFIDEAHTLIGAGGAAGTGDAANLLKPALARGELRTVAATTWAEYKKHIEKDPALTRRFQVVQVGEPSEERAILMMRGLASTLEAHHRVQLLDEAIEAAVKLSHRYIPARQLPDKAVSLLDTACARVAISQHAVPPPVDDCRKRIASLQTEAEIIRREHVVGIDTQEREQLNQERLAAELARLEELDEQWQAEKELVDRILELRAQLRAETGVVDAPPQPDSPADSASATNLTAPATSTVEPTTSQDELRAELRDLQRRLAELQGERPLILPTVDRQAVGSVVQDWTGIPVGRMVRNELDTVLHLADNLEKRIIGQRHALDTIARRIQTSRAGMDDPRKPIGVFMLAGTSGVGKTETALALAESLYGGEQNAITINMSEFQEAHTVSTLKGSPPGYVGYGEGGVLTEAVRRRPYSVVLLDEVEKAHPDVHEIFFQVFDKGWMEDGEGRKIDFKNTLILLTTNVGTELISSLCADPELIPEPDAVATALRTPLLQVFPPALLGRLVVVPYYPLSDEVMSQIIHLQLGRIRNRIRDHHRVSLSYDDSVIRLILGRCTEVESGGRMIDSILTNTLLPAISREFLQRLIEGQPITNVHIETSAEEFRYHFE